MVQEKFNDYFIDDLYSTYSILYKSKKNEGYRDIHEQANSVTKSDKMNDLQAKKKLMAEKVLSKIKDELNVHLEQKPKESEIFDKIIRMTDFVRENKEYIPELASQANVAASLVNDTILVKGAAEDIIIFQSLLFDLRSLPKKKTSIRNERLDQLECEIEISDKIRKNPTDFQNYFNQLGVQVSDTPYDKACLTGPAEQLIEVVHTLYRREASSNNKFEIVKLIQEEQIKVRVPLRQGLRYYIKSSTIVSSVEKQYEISLDIDENGLKISGKLKNVTEFQKFLLKYQRDFTKKLQYKYWDNNQANEVTVYDINYGTEEYKEIYARLSSSLTGIDIKKLQRIQNRTLMERYLSFQANQSEDHLKKFIDRRALLFHSTSTTDPEKIFYNEIGFDLQYSRFGFYGKGIYFGGSALVSHSGYAHEANNGNYKMIIADVFLGDAAPMGSNRELTKPPVGYDSVEAHSGTPDSFFVIYKHFQCCPLYIVEYTLPLEEDTFYQRVHRYPMRNMNINKPQGVSLFGLLGK